MQEEGAGGAQGGAEAQAAPVARRRCRYFAQGSCRYGQRCSFSHEFTPSRPRVRPLTPEATQLTAAIATARARAHHHRPPTRLCVYDFDGTLVNTPLPDDGVARFEAATGARWEIASAEDALASGYDEEFRRRGWWGRQETLLPPVFVVDADGVLNESVAAKFREDMAATDTVVVVMSGRPDHLHEDVLGVMQRLGLELPTELLLCKIQGRQPTLQYKSNAIDGLLRGLPSLRRVEVFEDRSDQLAGIEAHAHRLFRWRRANMRDFKLHYVDAGALHWSFVHITHANAHMHAAAPGQGSEGDEREGVVG